MSLEFAFINTQLNKNTTQLNDSTLVLFSGEIGKTKTANFSGLKNLSKDNVQRISDAFNDSTFKGNVGDTLLFRQFGLLGFKNLLMVGLGDLKKVSHETIRRATSMAYKNIKSSGIKSVAVSIETLPLAAKNKEESLNAFFEGFYLTEYTFDTFKSVTKAPKDSSKIKIQILTSNASLMKSAKNSEKSAGIVSECVNFARVLGDTPGNEMNPPILADTTKKAAQGTGLKVTVWDRARIKKEEMGNLLGVYLPCHSNRLW